MKSATTIQNFEVFASLLANEVRTHGVDKLHAFDSEEAMVIGFVSPSGWFQLGLDAIKDFVGSPIPSDTVVELMVMTRLSRAWQGDPPVIQL